MTRNRAGLIGVLLVVVLGGLAVTSIVRSDRTDSEPMVYVFGTSQERLRLPLSEALARVGAETGFEVRMPGELPLGQRLPLNSVQAVRMPPNGEVFSVISYLRVSETERHTVTLMQARSTDAWSDLDPARVVDMGTDSPRIRKFESGVPGEVLYEFAFEGMHYRWVFSHQQTLSETPVPLPEPSYIVEAIHDFLAES